MNIIYNNPMTRTHAYLDIPLGISNKKAIQGFNHAGNKAKISDEILNIIMEKLLSFGHGDEVFPSAFYEKLSSEVDVDLFMLASISQEHYNYLRSCIFITTHSQYGYTFCRVDNNEYYLLEGVGIKRAIIYTTLDDGEYRAVSLDYQDLIDDYRKI